MKIAYISNAMPEDDFKELFIHSSNIPGQQALKFNRLIVEGIVKNEANVKAISIRPINRVNSRAKFLKRIQKTSNGVEYIYTSIINMNILRNIHSFATVIIELLFRRTHYDAIIIDVLNATVSLAAAISARFTKCPCIGVVTDLPDLMVTGTSRFYTKLVNIVLDTCNGYVFMTEAMNDVINKKEREYTVIEGICDSNIEPHSNDLAKFSIKKCVYAGLLDARYGLEALLHGFIDANIEKAELHIYGDGSYKEEIQRLSLKNPNIVYHGVVINSEVVKAEKDASLLINPRPTTEEFAKFSFPSKNLEYMASGTPVLTTRLPGMPKDYYKYIFTIDREDAIGISEALSEALSQPPVVLNKIGNSAQRFVLENKNNKIQAKRIIDLIVKIKKQISHKRRMA